MNTDQYMGVLKDMIFPWMQMHHVLQFLQDGVPCHKAKQMMALLAAQDITVMDWLGTSPDLNPIMNLYSIMKRRLKDNQTITSMPLLHRAMKRMWVTNLPPALFKKLAHSMPKCLMDCIAINGQMTKY